jgi:hypothetical protein
MRSCSSAFSNPLPSSNVQILNLLTPERRANLLWEMPSDSRRDRSSIIYCNCCGTRVHLSSRGKSREGRGKVAGKSSCWVVLRCQAQLVLRPSRADCRRTGSRFSESGAKVGTTPEDPRPPTLTLQPSLCGLRRRDFACRPDTRKHSSCRPQIWSPTSRGSSASAGGWA